MHRRQVDMARGHGPIVQHRSTPPGIAQWPHPPCHVTDPWESLHTASPALIFVGLIQRWRLSCLGLLGPPSYTWRGQTDLQTAFFTEATSIGACNRHPGATRHRWMARQCRGWLADALPRLADAPCLSTASSSPTSTPMPSTHYKRGCGARWRSSLKHSKHSKLSRVVALEVVAS
jgi:hypothetical protein